MSKATDEPYLFDESRRPKRSPMKTSAELALEIVQQYASIPLLGVADGIATSARGAKLSSTVKSLVADLYLDDLRDRPCAASKGERSQDSPPEACRTSFTRCRKMDPYGRSLGSRIAIHDGETEIVRRTLREHREGVSLADIAKRLNREGKPYAKGELSLFTILAETENIKPAEHLAGLTLIRYMSFVAA